MYMSEPTQQTKPVYVVVTKTGDKGTIDAHKIYEGYTVEGWMFEPPVVGKTFTILRVKRNGVEKIGLFETSRVEEVLVMMTRTPSQYIFQTLNSYYRIDLHPEVEYDSIKVGVDFIASVYKELDSRPPSSKN